jgi:hypothetical protein
MLTSHLCVCHLVLDGHHKMLAVAETGHPIRLLTYFAQPLENASLSLQDVTS